MEEILEYFPIYIRNELKLFDLTSLEEIRVRNNQNIYLVMGQEEKNTNCIVNSKEILEILQKVCDNSIYTYQNQICRRFYNYKGWS